jgi:hypothetical protein
MNKTQKMLIAVLVAMVGSKLLGNVNALQLLGVGLIAVGFHAAVTIGVQIEKRARTNE